MRERAKPESDCADELRAEIDANVWVAVSFAGSDGVTHEVGTQPMKIGAVPFALETDHAVTATQAENIGSLAAADVQRRVASSCSVGQAIRAIAADGTVVCEPAPRITDWADFNPPIQLREWGTNNVIVPQKTTGRWRRVGDTIEVHFATSFADGKPAASANAAWYYRLPSADFPVDTSQTSLLGVAGETLAVDRSANAHYIGVPALWDDGALVLVTHGTSAVHSTSPFAFDDEDNVSLHATVPIAGWTATTPATP